jgi:diguanylate cyclase (GGDEF)-like protein
VAGNIIQPLERLRDCAIAFGRRQYATRVPVEREDEIGVLAVTFNEMAESIDNQIKRIIQLQEWSRVVAANLERSLVIQKVVEAFAELGGVGRMSLMMLDEQTGLLQYIDGIGSRPNASSEDHLLAGRVLDGCKKIQVAAENGIGQGGPALALPLMADRKCFGAIILREKRNGRPFDESDETILETLAEITAVALKNAMLYDLAITDGLTRLFISRYFHQRLEEEIVRTRRTSLPLSLLMCDLDHFKRVNDTYGHQTGDAVLIAVARQAKSVFREVDIPCRYGGEEFAIILPNTDRAGAQVVAERFREAIAKHAFLTPTGEHRVTISIGVSAYRLGRTKDELIGEADKALYAAKEAGRNRVVIHEGGGEK